MEPKEPPSASVAVTYREETMLKVKHSDIVYLNQNVLFLKRHIWINSPVTLKQQQIISRLFLSVERVKAINKLKEEHPCQVPFESIFGLYL